MSKPIRVLHVVLFNLAWLVLFALAPAARAQTDWRTFGFDVQHTGYNPHETVLSQQSVAGLGLLWSTPVGGPVLTQPTVLSRVPLSSGTVDLVYVATLNGDVFALNAATGAIVWKHTVPNVQTDCDDFAATGGLVGVIGTATIDRPHNRLYIVSGDGNLHALSIYSGGEIHGYPFQILDPANQLRTFVYGSATYDPGSSSLYIPTAGACDYAPYHGQIVKFNTSTISIERRWYVTGESGPNGGGIWGPGGVSLSTDATLIYALTGNALGTPEDPKYAESVVGLTTTFGVSTANTPALSGFDLDFGATPLLYQIAGCPPQLAAMNKSGAFFIYDRTTAMNSGPRQRIQITGTQYTDNGNFVGIPAFDPGRKRLFFGSPSDAASVYKHGLIAMNLRSDCTAALAWQRQVGLNNVSYNNPAIPPTVANGVVYYADGDASQVFAFNADTGALLWHDGTLIKGGIFAAPTVVNGKVFVAGYTAHAVYAFGLTGAAAATPAPAALEAPAPEAAPPVVSPLGAAH